MKGFRVLQRGCRFQAADAHQGQKSFPVEPVFVLLTFKTLQENVDFFSGLFLRQVAEAVWNAQVAVVFRDLVLQDQVIAERIPGQVRKKAVILVAVVVGIDCLYAGLYLAGIVGGK